MAHAQQGPETTPRDDPMTDAEPGLERPRLVVEPGVNYTAVVPRLMACDSRLLLQDKDAQGRLTLDQA